MIHWLKATVGPKTEFNPNALDRDIEGAVQGLERRRWELQFQIKRCSKEQEILIGEAVDCANKGDAIGKKDAARSLAFLKREISEIGRDLSETGKKVVLLRQTARRVQRQDTKDAQGANALIIKILQDPKIEEWLRDAGISERDISRRVDMELTRAIGEDQKDVCIFDEQFDDMERLIEEIAAARSQGNADKVADLMNRLQGRSEVELDDEFDV
jgi:hypothetical protein